MTIKISNLHPLIRLSHVVKLFSYFGKIKEVFASDEELAFFINFESEDIESKCLTLDGFVLAKKSLIIKKLKSMHPLTRIKNSNILLVFNFCGPENELIYEVQKYGNIKKIQKLNLKNEKINILFNNDLMDPLNRFYENKIDRYNWYYEINFFNVDECENVFLNLFGRWFNKNQIYCCF
ncbi:hypothetical protein DMUE_5905, partial [Dictyocoela muelleri]